MARIHRSVTTFVVVIVVKTDFARSDGQKRSVYIYRFLTAGTIDGGSDQLVEDRYLIAMHCIQKRFTSAKSPSWG